MKEKMLEKEKQLAEVSRDHEQLREKLSLLQTLVGKYIGDRRQPLNNGDYSLSIIKSVQLFMSQFFIIS